jgi:FHA domain/Domain of unknown function (DUF4388)
MSVAETLVIRPRPEGAAPPREPEPEPEQAPLLRLETEAGVVHTFDLVRTPRVSLGRHPSNDVPIRSRRVSGHHAEIRKEADGLFVYDMNSTNGTLVNEESVSRRNLSPGDRITVGGHTLTVRLVPRQESDFAECEGSRAGRFDVGAKGTLVSYRDVGDASDSAASGEASDTTLPALLKELSRESASVTVSISGIGNEGEARALVHMIAGGVVGCELGRARSEKALYRLLALPKGAFEILPSPTEAIPESMLVPLDALLAEGMQQVEALDKLTDKLPPMACEIRLNDLCAVAVNTLTADEVEIYALLIRHQTIGRILEGSAMTDFMVLVVVHGLLQRGFFRVPVTPEA